MNTLTETQVRLFTSARSRVEGEAVRQLYATAKLDGVRLAVVGCGMALFKTDLVRRDAKLDRWTALRFNLEHFAELQAVEEILDVAHSARSAWASSNWWCCSTAVRVREQRLCVPIP